MKSYFVYIMTNINHTTLYTGVTNDLRQRVYEHKNDEVEGFTKRYRLHVLVYYKTTEDINAAIAREKQIKGGCRQKKVQLINKTNPLWQDLTESI